MDVVPQTDQTVCAAVGADPIDSLRMHIDSIDDAIAHLVIERMRLSLQIQTARVNAGGPRIVLSRERAIRQRYLDALGSAGIAVADAMLRACRGQRLARVTRTVAVPGESPLAPETSPPPK